MIVGLHGPAQVGKDTVADILVREHGFTRFALADPMRASLLALDPLVYKRNGRLESGTMRLSEVVDRDGWDKAKQQHPEVRRLLQRYGTEAHRGFFGDDFWIEHTESLFGSIGKVVISDIRYKNEEEWVHRMPGQVWKITRPGFGPVNDHSSDNTEVDCDLTIMNDSTFAKLADQVDAVTCSWAVPD